MKKFIIGIFFGIVISMVAFYVLVSLMMFAVWDWSEMANPTMHRSIFAISLVTSFIVKHALDQ